MEQESIDFHHLVSEGYRKVLAERPEVIKIDGGKDIDVIQKKIRNHVDELLKKRIVKQQKPIESLLDK